MQKPSMRWGALVGLVVGIPLVALYYLGQALASFPFVPFDLFDWMARVLPGDLVTFGIDFIVEALRTFGLSVSANAKTVEQGIAIVMFLVATAVAGLLIAAVQRQGWLSRMASGLTIGFALFVVVIVAEAGLGTVNVSLLSVPWLLLLTVGWGAITGVLVAESAVSASDEAPDRGRRSLLLKLVGGSLGVALGATGLAELLQSSSAQVAEETGAAQPLPTPASAGAAGTPESSAAIPPTPSGRITPAPGTRSEVTSNEDFYRIDINTRPPVIDGATWQLEVAGLFSAARNLTIDDLMAFEPVTQPITLSCISNRIGGDLISTGYWTGVRLRDVLQELQLQPEAGALYVEAEDGFYETVVAADMMDERTLLVYGMNGETLPIEHGFPLRIYIPNRYGMKQPKWIVRIEAMEAWAPGYWVDRGWSREARPHIVSVVDTVAVDALNDGKIPVGGIAWAGDRGIQKVEVQVDDGDWIEAQLRKPPLGTLTWVQWRYDWPAESGRHTFTVRATDSTGMLQVAEETGVRPDGATGYHSRTENIA